MARERRPLGFTLVELLVVIGIIAILIAILLPALTAARRQAATVKCSAALKDLGNAMVLYAHDNKGYLPAPVIGFDYNVGSYLFDPGAPGDTPGSVVSDSARWFNLLGKYVMKGQSEGTATTADEMGQQFQRTVVWGCPAYSGYIVASDPNSIKGEINRNYPPYSMNRWPTFTASYPTPGGGPHFPTPNQKYRFQGAVDPDNGTWYKLTDYTSAAERALLADSRGLLLEARGATSESTIPGQPTLQNQAMYSPPPVYGTTLDFYRHGKYPERANVNVFQTSGGKVAYNILFADGHVTTMTDRPSGYRALRMRFPN